MTSTRTAHPRTSDRARVTSAELAEAPHDWASNLRHSVVMDGGLWHSVLSFAVLLRTLPHFVHAELYALRGRLIAVYTEQVRAEGLDYDADDIAEAADRALFAGDRYGGAYAVPESWDGDLWQGDQYLTVDAVAFLSRALTASGPNAAAVPSYVDTVAAEIAGREAL